MPFIIEISLHVLAEKLELTTRSTSFKVKLDPVPLKDEC
jgi:hypothetical protein